MKEEEQVIIFKDLCESQFNDDYNVMVDWLNEHNRLKEIGFIRIDDVVIRGNFTVNKYSEPEKIIERLRRCVLIVMDNNVVRIAKGLVFINNDFVGKEDLNSDEDFGIKWYVNGRLIDDVE